MLRGGKLPGEGVGLARLLRREQDGKQPPAALVARDVGSRAGFQQRQQRRAVVLVEQQALSGAAQEPEACGGQPALDAGQLAQHSAAADADGFRECGSGQPAARQLRQFLDEPAPVGAEGGQGMVGHRGASLHGLMNGMIIPHISINFYPFFIR